MRLAQLQDIRQQQTQRVDPRQILASEILSLTMAELDCAIEREMAENPALESGDVDMVLDSPQPQRDLVIESLLTSPTRLTLSVDESAERDASLRLTTTSAAENELDAPFVTRTAGDSGDSFDPLEFVSSAPSLREHLQSQVGHVVPIGVRTEIVRYLIECNR